MQLWILFAILSAVFAALVAIFGKVGLGGVDSTLATTVRSLVMAVFLLILSLLLGKMEIIKTINLKIFVFILLSGIAGALSWLFYFFALKLGPAPGVAALDRLSVVFVLLFAVIFLAQPLSWKLGVGALLVTLGAILMSL